MDNVNLTSAGLTVAKQHNLKLYKIEILKKTNERWYNSIKTFNTVQFDFKKPNGRVLSKTIYVSAESIPERIAMELDDEFSEVVFEESN